jgi:hypothetical protein
MSVYSGQSGSGLFTNLPSSTTGFVPSQYTFNNDIIVGVIDRTTGGDFPPPYWEAGQEDYLTPSDVAHIESVIGNDTNYANANTGPYNLIRGSMTEPAGNGTAITGTFERAVIVAGNGNDTISDGHVAGHPIDDIIVGGAGNDLIEAGLGNDTIYGGSGQDTLDLTPWDQVGDNSLQFSETDGTPGFKITDDNAGAPNSETAQSVSLVQLPILDGNTLEVDSIPDQLAGVGAVTIDGGDELNTGDSFTDNEDTLDLSKVSGPISLIGGQVYGHGLTNPASYLGTGLKFQNFNNIILNDQNDVFIDNTPNATIHTGNGNDFIFEIGAGSTVTMGSGQDTVWWGPDVGYVFGSNPKSELDFYGVRLSGGLRNFFSASPFAEGVLGIEYGLNHQDQLVIHAPWMPKNLQDAFILNWGSGVRTLSGGGQVGFGDIVVGTFEITTSLLLHAPPGTDVLSALNIANALNKIAFHVQLNGTDPLVMDLSGGGFDLTPESPISPLYDINKNMYAVHTGWIAPTNGFLVQVGAGGQISMFGGNGQSGFAALGALDANGDGVIDASDPGFANLMVWVDANEDGVVDPGELESLSQLGIVAIDLTTTPAGQTINGNIVNETATFVYADGHTGTIGDVTFTTDNFDSTYVGPAITISDAAAAEPELKGYGTLVSLRQALSLHPELIPQVDAALASITSPDLTSIEAALQPVFTAWMEGSPVELPDGTIVSGPGAAPTLQDMLTLKDSNGNVLDYTWNISGNTWSFASGTTVELTGGDGNLQDVAANDGGVTNAQVASVTIDGVASQQTTDTFANGATLVVTVPNGVSVSPVLAAILDGVSGGQSWETVSGAEVAFFQRYSGNPLLFNQKPADPSEAGQALTQTLKDIDTTLQNLSAELVVQKGPLSAMFAGITYDPVGDHLVPTTNRQLEPVFQNLLQAAQGQSDPIGYLASWQPLLLWVENDYDQGDASVANTYGFLAQALIGAYEAVQPSFDLVAAANALGIPSTLFITGAPGATLNDSSASNIFYITGGGQTALGGQSSNDTYIVGQNFGQSVINNASGNYNILRFTDLDVSDITATEDGGDLILTASVAGDQIQVDRNFGNYSVAKFEFADGTVLTAQQLVDLSLVASPTNTQLVGAGGADTFTYDAGSGAVDISESRPSAAVLQFGPGVSASQIAATIDANGDLVLADGISGDQITMIGMAQSAFSGVSEAVFADGTVLTAQQLLALAVPTGSPTNTQLYGAPGADVFDSRGFATYEQGNGGADTFIYNQGYGQLEINEQANSGAILEFGAGITLSDISVTTDATAQSAFQGDLIVTDGVTGDVIKLDNMATGFGGVSEVQFADGAVVTAQQLADIAFVGAPGKTSLIAPSFTAFPLTFDSKGFATYEQGDGGVDTFIYNQGYGQLEIKENAQFNGGQAKAALQFGAGVSASDLTVTADAAGDLIITDGVTGDQIKLDGMADNASLGVAQVEFADGTSLTRQQLLSLVNPTGSATNTRLYGTSGANVFDSKGFAAYEQGDGGGDTFVYNTGYGLLQINEVDPSSTPDNVLSFGAGISASDVTVSRNSNGDVLLILGGGDEINLRNALAGDGAGVQSVTFADGSSWTQAQLIAMAQAATPVADTTTGSPVAPELFGTSGADLFDSKAFATYEQGNGGADTFIYNRGYGQLEIKEDAGSGQVSTATLQFGPGITASQLTVSQDGAGDFIIADGAAGDQIKLDGMASGAEFGVASVQFADGSSLSAQQLFALSDIGTAANTQLYGTSGADLFDSKGFATYEQGAGGADTFVYNSGYGNLEIFEDAGAGNVSNAVVQFGAGITASDIQASIDFGGDLTLTDGVTGDQIRIDSMANGSEFGVSAVEFADGTSLSAAQLETLADTGSPTNTQLIGTAGNDVIDSKGFATSADGNGGDDTFIYDKGYGQLQINEFSATNLNVIQFGAGIDPSDISETTNAAGDIFLTDAVAGDQIELLSADSSTTNVTFANGVTWSNQQLLDQAVIEGSPTQTDLVTQAPAIFDSKGYAKFYFGSGGADTFIYDQGYGALSIVEDAGSGNETTAVLEFGPGITPSEVTARSSFGDNLVLDVGNSHDAVTLQGEAQSTEFGVAEAVFADGTVLTQHQLIQLSLIGSPTNTDLTAPTGAYTFDTRGFSFFSASETAQGGGDTFVYNAGYGALTINETDTSANPDNVLAFGAGISPAAINVSNDGFGDIVLTDGDSGDQITLSGALDSSPGDAEGVQKITFSDGVVWSAADLAYALNHPDPAGTILGGPQRTQLVGTAGADVFDSLGVATLEKGDGGADTFIYNAGDGSLEINEDNPGQASTATLAFGPGVTASDLSGSTDAQGDLILTDGVTGDRIVLDRELVGSTGAAEFGVSQATFDDGTVLTRAELLARVELTGSATQTQLFGTPGADVFDSKGFATYEQGNGGADTFIYNQGYGALEINEDAGVGVQTSAVIETGPGLGASQLSASSDAAGNLFITDGVAGDQIKLDDEMLLGPPATGQTQGADEFGVSGVVFADGTALTRQQLIALADTGSATNTLLYGTAGADVFVSNGFATYEQGNGGADTFEYDQGWGALEIRENAGVGLASAAVLAFGPGVTAAGISARISSNGVNLVLTDGVTGDQITLDNEGRLGSSGLAQFGVAEATFADGTSLTRAQLLALADTGTAANTKLYGTTAADTFVSNGFATLEQGNGGADTFVYDQGWGPLEINENAGAGTAGTAILAFGPGIAASQIQASIDAAGDLVLTDGVTGDQITLDEMTKFDGAGLAQWGVAKATFADGTQLSRQQLINLALIGSPTRTTLTGTAGADTFLSNGFATLEQGNGGADTFVYDQGWGTLEINENAGASTASKAVLAFGPGITAANIVAQLSTNGDDLTLTDGVTGDQITLDDEGDLDTAGLVQWGVAEATFADGTLLTRQQLINLADTGSASNTKLYGTKQAETFVSNGFATYEQGNSGADTFEYDQGWGALEINENNGAKSASTAVLAFGPGIAASAITASISTNGANLVLTDGATGDAITLDGMAKLDSAGRAQWGVAEATFADGTSLTRAQLLAQADTGSATNTKLYGTKQADTFISNGFATYEQGNSGADTFTYNQGWGVLEINENNSATTASTAVLAFGPGITAANITASISTNGANLVLTDGTTGDQITLDNEAKLDSSGLAQWGVAEATFADGTSLTRAQLLAQADTGSATNTKLYGTTGADTFVSNGFATYEQGNGGADTFNYNPGWGALEVNENAGANTASTATLAFGTGITASQITASLSTNGDNLILTDGTTGDQITIDNMGDLDSAGLAQWGVAEATFADGTSLSAAQLLALADVGSASNTKLYGTENADTFVSNGFATYEQGNGGADTFEYDPGWGVLEINENNGASTASTAVVAFGPGITAANITASISTNGANLILTDGTSGDQITLDNEGDLNAAGLAQWGVAAVTFSNGTSLTRAQLLALADTGSATNTKLYGTKQADVFVSNGFATYEQGNSGADTFEYNQGWGALEINENNGASTASTAVVAFGPGVTAANITAALSANGLNLILTDGTSGDQITIDNETKLDSAGLAQWGVAGVTFSDGTSLSRSQLIALADTGSATNTKLYGTSGADTFVSNGFATYEQGNGGADTFDYNLGWGALEVSENAGASAASTATLAFGPGITASQIAVSGDAGGDIILTDGQTGDSIKLDDEAKLDAAGLAQWGRHLRGRDLADAGAAAGAVRHRNGDQHQALRHQRRRPHRRQGLRHLGAGQRRGGHLHRQPGLRRLHDQQRRPQPVDDGAQPLGVRGRRHRRQSLVRPVGKQPLDHRAWHVEPDHRPGLVRNQHLGRAGRDRGRQRSDAEPGGRRPAGAGDGHLRLQLPRLDRQDLQRHPLALRDHHRLDPALRDRFHLA